MQEPYNPLFVPTTNEAFSQCKRFIDMHVTSKLDGSRQYNQGQEAPYNDSVQNTNLAGAKLGSALAWLRLSF